MRVEATAIVIGAALVTGCEVDEALGSDGGPDGAVAIDAAAPAMDAGPAIIPPPDEPASQVEAGTWIVVHDLTTGLAIGVSAGIEVDAVRWRCPDGSEGYGVRAEGRRRGAAAEVPVDRALGPPDGPCDPPAACAAPTGLHGWIAVGTEAEDLAGCEVTVYEHADLPDERFQMFTCPAPDLDGQCTGPHLAGGDGETPVARIP